MGAPPRLRKKYEVPRKAWEKTRIESEKVIVKNFGIKRKKELRRAETVLRNLKRRARALIGRPDPAEEKVLLGKAYKLALIKKDATLDDILNLTIENILERRLATQLVRKGIANTMGQARQLIGHGHILVGQEKIVSPSYLVERDEEAKIALSPRSAMARVQKIVQKK